MNFRTCADNNVAAYPTQKFFASVVDRQSVKSYFFLVSYINQKLLGLENTNKFAELNENNFHNHTAVGGHFVMFYAPWCQYSRGVYPLMKRLSVLFPVSVINCHIHRSICDQPKFKIKVNFLSFSMCHVI